VLADSQSDPHTMENHAGRPESCKRWRKAAAAPSATAPTINRDLVLLRGAGKYLHRETSAFCVLRFPWKLSGKCCGPFSPKSVAGIRDHFIWRGNTGGAGFPKLFRRVERLTAFSSAWPKAISARRLPMNTGDALDVLSGSLNQTAARLDRTIRTLTEERNLSSAILGSMVEGVLVVNAAERVVFANHSFAKFLI